MKTRKFTVMIGFMSLMALLPVCAFSKVVPGYSVSLENHTRWYTLNYTGTSIYNSKSISGRVSMGVPIKLKLAGSSNLVIKVPLSQKSGKAKQQVTVKIIRSGTIYCDSMTSRKGDVLSCKFR